MKAVGDFKKKSSARLWEGARRGGMAVEFFTSPCSPWALLPGGSHHQSFPCTIMVPWESSLICFASSGSLRWRSARMLSVV